MRTELINSLIPRLNFIADKSTNAILDHYIKSNKLIRSDNISDFIEKEIKEVDIEMDIVIAIKTEIKRRLSSIIKEY